IIIPEKPQIYSSIFTIFIFLNIYNMKSLIKITTKIFLTLIIFCNLFFVFGVEFSYAADKNFNEECAPSIDKCLTGSCKQDMAGTYRCLEYAPQVYIPGVVYSQPKGSAKALGEYIKGFYNYAVGITAIVATVVLMIGGFQWIIAGGSGEKIGEAKAWITAALSGLVLALSSYMILSLVNPKLVNLEIQTIKPIAKIEKNVSACCASDGTKVATVSTTDPNSKRVTVGCPTGATDCDVYCSGKADGTKCNTDAFCYKKECLVGDGGEGEVCGGGFVGVCADTCITNIIVGIGQPWVASIYLYGRSCGEGLYCCSW
ncbi:MAG: pilin, partial [Candidatus Magasanikbacteria bacterium]|nr:pilin [Candidatus Magasanikbacteria bacterium]